jgi:polysaccharide biosynthesis protein PslH
MVRQPRILYVAPCWPHERAYGTQQRVLHVGRALKEIGELHYVVTELHDNRPPGSECAAEFAFDRFLPLEQVLPRSIWSRFRCGFDPRFVNPFGHRVSSSGQAWLSEHLENFDLIWLHHFRTASVFERWKWPRSVMDVDDIPSTFQRTELQNSVGLGRRLRTRLRMRAAARRERLLGERFSVLSVCSEADRRYLNLQVPVHVIPNGFEAPKAEPVRRPVVPPRIGFIGLFDYRPNSEGVKWFVEKCWPLIKGRLPTAELRLVGRGTDGPLKPSGPDIHGLGYVANASDEIATWSAMIIPVHLGAGTRVKIAEGFSRKVPMVATGLGAHGYDVRDGVEMYIANTAEDFAAACERTIEDREVAAQMAHRGWLRFKNEWTWDAIKPRVWAAAEEALRLSRGDRGRNTTDEDKR